MAAIGVLAMLASLSTFAQDEQLATGRAAAVAGDVGETARPSGIPLGWLQDDAWATVEVTLPIDGEPVSVSDTPSQRGDERASPAATGDTSSRLLRRSPPGGAFLRASQGDEPGGSSWLRTTGSLAAVVALIILLGWGYRAVAGGRVPFSRRGKRPGLIEIISRTALSPKHSLHLVRVGPRVVLVGMSNDSLVALDVVDDADAAARLAGQAAERQADSHTREFSHCLEREAAGYDGRDEGLNETTTPEETRLFDVKQQLAGTIRRVRAAVGGA
jgi:flagellar biogenesis protein FliO